MISNSEADSIIGKPCVTSQYCPVLPNSWLLKKILSFNSTNRKMSTIPILPRVFSVRFDWQFLATFKHGCWNRIQRMCGSYQRDITNQEEFWKKLNKRNQIKDIKLTKLDKRKKKERKRMSYKFDISQRPAEIIWRNSQIALMFVMNILLPVNVKSLKEKYGINLKKKEKKNKIK